MADRSPWTAAEERRSIITWLRSPAAHLTAFNGLRPLGNSAQGVCEALAEALEVTERADLCTPPKPASPMPSAAPVPLAGLIYLGAPPTDDENEAIYTLQEQADEKHTQLVPPEAAPSSREDLRARASRFYEEHYDTLQAWKTVDALARLLDDVRRETVEACAQVADDFAGNACCPRDSSCDYVASGEKIRDDIRALQFTSPAPTTEKKR